MRLLTAGLIYVAISSVAALLLGMDAGGLNQGISFVALIAGAMTAVLASNFILPIPAVVSSQTGKNDNLFARYRSSLFWLIAFIFALFALRSFCWLLYYDGNVIRIQSPNNLGDIGLHITYIRTFANGVSLWPDSPIFVFSKLRYPAGIDLFNALLSSIGLDLRHHLVATGLIASAATFYAFYRWSGLFGVAGFLFNGGIIGYQFFRTLQFIDYQGGRNISWKSIPLSMFVTQRGLLYAIPAGLLLLWQWRAKFGTDPQLQKERLPTWIEYVIYATMPLFHVHSFLALNIVIAFLFIGRPESRLPLLKLVAAAFLPATFFVWLITDHLHAKSVFEWHPGWTQNVGDFAMPFFSFWFVNFGAYLPLMIALVGFVGWREWNRIRGGRFELSMNAILLAAAAAIFLFAVLVKTGTWEWDNTKILIWAYFITLPVLWEVLVRDWPAIVRTGVCTVLFFSGFVSLIGGLAAGRPGFEFANRAEVDLIASAIRGLPIESRFAAFPIYNHPLLLNGRKLVCGYDGHLWSQGIDYGPVLERLQTLMLGQGDWMKTARSLRVRYIFWGREEEQNYATSLRPWVNRLPVVAKGPWGAIYDIGSSGG